MVAGDHFQALDPATVSYANHPRTEQPSKEEARSNTT